MTVIVTKRQGRRLVEVDMRENSARPRRRKTWQKRPSPPTDPENKPKLSPVVAKKLAALLAKKSTPVEKPPPPPPPPPPPKKKKRPKLKPKPLPADFLGAVDSWLEHLLPMPPYVVGIDNEVYRRIKDKFPGRSNRDIRRAIFFLIGSKTHTPLYYNRVIKGRYRNGLDYRNPPLTEADRREARKRLKQFYLAQAKGHRKALKALKAKKVDRRKRLCFNSG